MRIVIPSAAAFLVLVSGLALFILHVASDASLAEVVKAAEKHNLVRYRQQQSTETKEGSGPLDSIVYSDLNKPRTRSESQAKNAGADTTLIDIQDPERHLMTNSAAKSAWVGPGNKNRKSFLNGLQEFQQKKGVTTSKDKIDGRETIRYRLEENGNTTQLWVDAGSKLPVRLVYEMIDPTPKISRNRFTWTDFEWDPALPNGVKDVDELFSTRPPEGYALDDQVKKGR